MRHPARPFGVVLIRTLCAGLAVWCLLSAWIVLTA